MEEVVVVRHADRAVCDAVLDLAASAAEHSGRPSLSDHLLLDLQSGGAPGFAGFLLAHPGRPRDLVAYGQVSATNEGRTLEVVVDPSGEADAADATGRLVDAAVTELSAHGGGHLAWWVTEPTEHDEQLARAAGLHEDRRLHQMRRSLPLDVRSEVPTRAFVVGRDEEAWLSVNNRAFAGHGEQGGWTLDVLALREREPWFDPEGFRLHERDGRLAAFCWTKVHDPGTDDEAGEIYVIAVDPDFHGHGLGRQLTLAGLDHLADAGITRALLYVAAENDAAIGLYRSLGFDIAITRAAFTGDIRAAAPDLRA